MIQEFSGYLVVMLVLAAASAFFSCTEAALFSLRLEDRRVLKRGNAAQRTAIELLKRPDRVLTAILFWNLLVNVTFFALSSVVSMQLQHADRGRDAATFAIASLVALIVCGEMLPKTIGVQQPRVFASLLSLPLAATVRALDPVMPAFAAINRMLQRLLLPNFRREPYLEINDLERAITLSTDDAQLAAKEQSALQNIVLLSELPAEELMRPRKQYSSFTPPVNLEDLNGELPRGGYLLITESDSDEIAAAVPLRQVPTAPRRHLEQFATPVTFVPWCAAVATVLEELRRQDREVAAVVNEMGETIGIITLEDIMETIFGEDSSRSARLLAMSPLSPVGENRWRVTGMTNLRRLGRHFAVPLEPSTSVTVAGILQEQLQRLPVEGDEVQWSGFTFRVIEANDDSPLKVELQLEPPGGPLP